SGEQDGVIDADLVQAAGVLTGTGKRPRHAVAKVDVAGGAGREAARGLLGDDRAVEVQRGDAAGLVIGQGHELPLVRLDEAGRRGDDVPVARGVFDVGVQIARALSAAERDGQPQVYSGGPFDDRLLRRHVVRVDPGGQCQASPGADIEAGRGRDVDPFAG